MVRDRQVDTERQAREPREAREATKVNREGETSSGRSRRYAKDKRDEDFPTCHVCDKVFNRGNSWRQNEHGRISHMKTHDADEEREPKTPSEVNQSCQQAWSPFRGIKLRLVSDLCDV